MLFPQLLPNVNHILDEKIARVRMLLFHSDFSNLELELPRPVGDVIIIQEKIFIPVNEYPEYNFIGRILGPRGMTIKQMEQETECKIMIRGKGSLRDKKKEMANYGKVNWEHLEEELHILIQCEDTPNRATVKIKNAVRQIKKLLLPVTDGADKLKKKQLMELSIINGTYNPSIKFKTSNSDFFPTINTKSPVRCSVSRTNSYPMYSNSTLNSLSSTTTSLFTSSLSNEYRSPIIKNYPDGNFSTLDNLLHQYYLAESVSPTSSIFDSSAQRDVFSCFYNNRSKEQFSFPNTKY